MRIKLLKEIHGTKVGSVVEVEDYDGKIFVKDGSAIEYTETVAADEQKRAINKEVTMATEEKVEVKEVKVDGPQILVKKYETKSFRDAILDLKNGKIPQIEFKAPTGQDETDAADGLNLVYQGMDQLKGALEFGAVVAPKCEKLPTPGPSEYGRFIPYRDESTVSTTSSPRVYRPGEGTTKTPSKQAFNKHDLKFGTDAIVVYLTEEILADVNYIQQYVINSCRGKLAWERDYQIMMGTYAAGTQGFIGVLDAGANNFRTAPVAHADPWTGAIVNGVVAGVDPRLRAGAEWYMSNNTHMMAVGDLGSGTTVSTQPLFSNNNKTLAGYPVNIMTQLGAFAAGAVIFGNFAYYGICEKTGIVMTVSKDLAFLTDEIVLRFTQRALGAPTFREYRGLDAVDVAAFSTTS